MTSQLLALAAGLALLAGCATGEKPADEMPSGREQTLVELRAVFLGARDAHAVPAELARSRYDLPADVVEQLL